MSNGEVGLLPRFRRSLIYGLFAILIAATAGVVFIPIQQQILRRRSERLLVDIRSLNLRKSTWTDAQAIFSRWGAWGHYDGTCTPKSCSYSIELGDLTNTHLYLAQHFLFVHRMYRLFGGRTSLVRAGLSVQDGLIWAKGFSLFIAVPPEQAPSGHEYTLIGSAWSVSRFYRPVTAEHPNYVVYTPDGCTGCLAVGVEFSPYADASDVQRLMQFDLSCLTKRHACREKAEIMPASWVQYLQDADKLDFADREQHCSTSPLKVLGRDSENAAIVDVLANRMEGGGTNAFQVSTVRLIKKVKAASFWNVQTNRDVRVFQGTVSRTPHNMPSDVVPGARFILLFYRRDWNGPAGPDVWLDFCGALPLTDQNLQEVQRGVDQDYLAARSEEQ